MLSRFTGSVQGSDGECRRRLTRVVGPPSEERNCFGAMKLRIQWPEAGSLPFRAGIYKGWALVRIRQAHWLPAQFKAGRLRHERNLWSSSSRMRLLAGRL